MAHLTSKGILTQRNYTSDHFDNAALAVSPPVVNLSGKMMMKRRQVKPQLNMIDSAQQSTQEEFVKAQ